MQTSKPMVSVIIPAYNAEKYLGEAVRSILAQTFTDFELLIIDDGSSDNTLQVANAFTDPRIRIIANKENLGVPRTRNIGWKEARGQFIAHQDADDYSRPTRLEKQITYLRSPENKKIGVLGTNRQTIGRKGKIRAHKTMPKKIVLDDLLHKNPIINGSVMMRSSVLEKMNGYDEWFSTCEDYDLWLRIANESVCIRIFPEALYVFREHDESTTTKNLRSVELYHMAALNNIKGNLTNEMRKKVADKGIELYVPYLSIVDQLKFTKSLIRVYKRTRNYKMLLTEYKNLAMLHRTRNKISTPIANKDRQ